MANSVDELLVIIDATTENLRRELKRAEREVDKTSSAIVRAQDKMTAGWKSAGKWIEQNRAQFQLLGAAAVAGAGLAVRSIINYSDQFKNLQGQLKLVTDGQESLNTVWNEALQISNRTGSSLDATVTLYARMARATEDLGVSQSQLLGFTETINQAFVVSGATSEEASNAIIQLSQGMAAGALRGEELNAVLEQSPRLATLIADELGTTVGKLKEYGKEGAITSEVLVEAFTNGAAEIQEEFDQLPITVERATNRISNLLADAFGRANTQPLVNSLNEFGDLLEDPKIIKGLTDLASAMVEVTNEVIKAAAAVPSFAAGLGEALAKITGNIGGASSMQGLIDEYARLNKELEHLASQGQVTGGTVNGIKKDMEALEKQLAATDQQFVKVGKTWQVVGKRIDAITVTAEKWNKATVEGTQAAEDSEEVLQTKAETLEKVDAALDKIFEAEQKAARQAKERYDETIKGLQAEQDAVGRSAELQAGYNALQKEGLDLTSERGRALFRQATETWRAVDAQERWNETVANAGKEGEEAARRIEEAWAGARKELSEFFFEFARDGEDAFGTLAKGFEALLMKMVADAAANQIFLGIGSAATAIGAEAVGAAATKAGGGGSFDPITAAATVAASFVASKVFGEDNDGSNRGKSTFDLSTGSNIGKGVGKSFDQGNVTAATQLVEGLQQFADLIGGSSFAGRVFVGGEDGIRMSGKKFGDDQESFFQFGFDEVIRGAEHLDDTLKEMLISFEGTAEEITQYSAAMIQMREAVQSNPVEMALQDTLDAMDAASSGLVGAYSKQAEQVHELISAYDGSSGATVQLNEALQSARQLAYEAATAIVQLSESIGELLGDQAQYFRESIMSQEELQRARENERASILDALRSATNPEEVERLVNEFADVNRKLFDSLADEQQRSRIDEFTGLTEEVDEIAQGILGRSLEELKFSQDDINRRMIEEITGVVGSMQDVVDGMGNHIDRFGGYINELVRRGILVTAVVPETETL